MSHTILYNSESQVIEINIQGDLTLNVAEEIISEVMWVAKEHNCFLILNDMRGATLKLSTMAIHGLPKIMSDILTSSGLSVYKFKRAIVAAKDLNDYGFFKTVTVNRS